MGLHYLTFMGRNLENRKKLMFIQIMENAFMNLMNIVNSVGSFSDSVAMNNIFNEYCWNEQSFL